MSETPDFEVEDDRTVRAISRAEVIASAPDRWAEQYAAPKWQEDPDKRRVTERLAALKGSTFTAEQVDQIVGNTSWTTLECEQCRNPAEALATFGLAYSSMSVCSTCLTAAGFAIRAALARAEASS